MGLHGDALKVKIKAPPEDGRANAELLTFLAGALQISQRSLSLVAGQTSRRKVVELIDMEWDQVVKTFDGLLKQC